MATLRERLETLAETQRKMGEASAAALVDPARKAELVAMRRRFATELAETSEAIDRDPKLRSDPALAQEFRHRFSRMRSMVAVHQAKWPVVLLDSACEDFRASAAAVTVNNSAFQSWARSVLS